DGIDVKPNEHINGVEVELTNKVTTVSGIVTDGRGGAAKDCWTVIFPADSKRWTRSSRYIRAWRAGPDGRFKAAGMRPGDYYIIALDKMEPGESELLRSRLQHLFVEFHGMAHLQNARRVDIARASRFNRQ
ncbi:MAG: hypothetical protein DMG01_08850, partial [Acidobacteria bacterium]